jgi:branched-chain amino acid transport system substrate-binding protein
MLKIGLLLPRSTLFPSFGMDILDGFMMRLQNIHLWESVQLLTDNIGFGANEQDVYSKAEKMILQEDADIVIIVADSRGTEIVQPLFNATNKILLVLNCGTDVAENWDASATTIIHTLNFSFCCRLTGMLAANSEKKEVINTMSYYDAGYFQCFSMLNGNQSNGGVPAFYHITNLRLAEFTLEPLETYLQQQETPQNLLCLFCGEQAERFYIEIAALQKKYNFKMFVAPMLLDEHLKNTLYDSFSIKNVNGIIPWNAVLLNTANQIFKDTLLTANKKINYFSLLGWDAATIIQFAYAKKIDGISDAATIIKMLIEVQLESPRGWLKIDKDTHNTYGPVYLAQCENHFVITIKENELDIQKAFEDFQAVKINLAEASSWKNTYLCI